MKVHRLSSIEEESKRGPVLTPFDVLFTILALSNISKPLREGRAAFFFGGRAGFVFFGSKRLAWPAPFWTGVRNIPAILRRRNLAAKAMGSADGLGVCGLRAH